MGVRQQRKMMPWPSHLNLRVNEPFDPADVTEIEQSIGVKLPEQFLTFVKETNGGGYVDDLLAECLVPTPFGKSNIVEIGGLPGVIRLLDSDVTPRNMICIGHGHFGMTTCLSIAGIDHGCVYALDTEMRYFWTNERISKYPSLAPSIKEFFKMRDNDELPERPWGYENCYLIAEDFDEYLSKLHPASEC
ncbi:MAG: SMI1/KNR4 family protein [Planctomycetes bacterium]|nr:SMI1/KNR4 family protein [Planctomycetota bacterium]